MSLSHGTVSAAPDSEAPVGASLRQQASHNQRGLIGLCVIEGCERFAATTLGSLLILYVTEEKGASPAEALRLASNFNALCYLAPIVGGVLLDRLLGGSRAMRTGASLLAVAYSALALGFSSSLRLVLLLLVAGHGLFKPAINTLLSSLYPLGEKRREAAHTWFYFAINLGTMLAPLVTGLVRAKSGFDFAFSVAACSMAVSVLATYAVVLLPPRNGPIPARVDVAESQQQSVLTQNRTNVGGFVALCATVVAASASFAQCNGVLLLWARDDVQRIVFGGEIPVSWFAALPALLVLAVGPFITIAHGQAARGGQAVSAQRKIMAGLCCISLAFILLAVAARLRQPGGLIGPAWIVAAYLLLTLGELFIIPLTQALLAELVPPKKAGLVSGLWFAALAGGHWLAGALGILWSTIPHESFFAGLAIFVSAVGVLAPRYLRTASMHSHWMST